VKGFANESNSQRIMLARDCCRDQTEKGGREQYKIFTAATSPGFHSQVVSAQRLLTATFPGLQPTSVSEE